MQTNVIIPMGNIIRTLRHGMRLFYYLINTRKGIIIVVLTAGPYKYLQIIHNNIEFKG